MIWCRLWWWWWWWWCAASVGERSAQTPVYQQGEEDEFSDGARRPVQTVENIASRLGWWRWRQRQVRTTSQSNRLSFYSRVLSAAVYVISDIAQVLHAHTHIHGQISDVNGYWDLTWPEDIDRSQVKSSTILRWRVGDAVSKQLCRVPFVTPLCLWCWVQFSHYIMYPSSWSSSMPALRKHSQLLLSDAFVWRLSVAYIGPKSRTERSRKTKIGTEVAHVTRDSDTTFKVERSKVNLLLMS